MNPPSPVFSTNAKVQDEGVIFVIDTNILIEFVAINQVDWGLLCPRASSIRLVVPTTVVREMDKHKKGTGRLRRRALEFNKLLLQIEDGDGETAILDHGRVELCLMLMPRYPRSELREDKLCLGIADDMIVAEAARFNQDQADAIFLADDNNARRAARDMGIPVARPAEEWRRRERRDQRDARIEELERQLGAIPRLSLSLLSGDENAVIFQPMCEHNIPQAFCERISSLILEQHPGVSREELLRWHNLDNFGPMAGFQVSNPFTVSIADVEQYCRSYEEFKEGVVEWSRQIPVGLSHLDFAAPIHVEVMNNGEAFAEDVEIELMVSNGFGFVPRRLAQSYLELEYQPPELRSTWDRMQVPTLAEQQGLARRDPHSFYFRDSPSDNGLVSRISYECARFRHETTEALQSTLMKRHGSPLGGQLTVRVSSASLAKSVEARYPVRVNPVGGAVDFKEYLRRRLFFFPEEVRSAVAEVLEEF